MSAGEYLQPHLFHEVRTDDPEGPYQYVTPSGLNLERDSYSGAQARGFLIEDAPTPGVHTLRTTDRYVDPQSRSMTYMDQTPKPGTPESTWHANRHLNTQALLGEVGASAYADPERGMGTVPFDAEDLAMRDEKLPETTVTVFHDRRDSERVLGRVNYDVNPDGTTMAGNAYLDPAFRGQGLSRVAAKAWTEGRGSVVAGDFSAAGQAVWPDYGVRSRGGLSGGGRR